MNEKLQILKDSIDQVFETSIYKQYIFKKTHLEQDEQFKMYYFILNNKDKFSTKVYFRAKLKYVNKQVILKQDREHLDQVFNKILSLYDEY